MPLVAVDCLILQICYADNSVKLFCLVPCILCIHLRQLGCLVVAPCCYLCVCVCLSMYLCTCICICICICIYVSVAPLSVTVTIRHTRKYFHDFILCHLLRSTVRFKIIFCTFLLRTLQDLLAVGCWLLAKHPASVQHSGIHQFHLLLTPNMRTMLTKRYEDEDVPPRIAWAPPGQIF